MTRRLVIAPPPDPLAPFAPGLSILAVIEEPETALYASTARADRGQMYWQLATIAFRPSSWLPFEAAVVIQDPMDGLPIVAGLVVEGTPIPAARFLDHPTRVALAEQAMLLLEDPDPDAFHTNGGRKA